MNRKKQENKHCPNCGAPVSTEVCPYCHAATGISTWQADMEYPVIDCKEANIGFWTVFFPMIFAVSFGFFGFIFPFFFIAGGLKTMLFVFLACSLFGIIGIVSFVIALRPIIGHLKVKTKGKGIEGTVYGYINDNVYLNGEPAQVAKILVDTNDGPKFIMYQLGDIHQPYKINSKIKIKVYKDNFLIVKDQNDYFS